MVNEKDSKAVVKVAGDQLSLAIGKGGQNARLAAKLSGWKIDIVENLASTYINLRDFESATELAAELFGRDSNSPSGHIIMMTIASSFGNDKQAKEHYSAFLDHGQEHLQYRQILEYFKRYSE